MSIFTRWNVSQQLIHLLNRYSADTITLPRIQTLAEEPEDDELLRRPPSAYFDMDRLSASSATLAGNGPSPSTTTPTTPNDITPPIPNKGHKRQKWTHVIKDLPKNTWSRANTPTASTPGTPMTDVDEWISPKEWEKMQEKKERKRRRKKAEIYVRLVFICD